MKYFFSRIQENTKKKGLHRKCNTFFPRIQVKTKKNKRSSPAMKHFFSPNSSTDLRSDAHQSQIIGGDAGEDHTQSVGGDTVKLLGDIPFIPPGFRHLWLGCFFAIHKKYVLTVQYIDRVRWKYLYSTTPFCRLAKFRCCGTIVFHGCCNSYSKTSCFSDGILRLFEVARVAQDHFDDMPSTSST